MELISKSTTTTTISVSAVTTPLVPQETWKATWKIQQMRHIVGTATAAATTTATATATTTANKESRSKNIIAKFPFEMGRSFGQEVTLKWTLKCFEEVADPEGADETDSDDEDESGETIGLILSPVNPSKSKSDDKWLQIFFRASAKIILGDEVLFEGDTAKSDILRNGRGWPRMVQLSKLGEYLDSEETMTLAICVVAYYDPTPHDEGAEGASTTIVTREDSSKLSTLEEKFLERNKDAAEPLLNKIACLLGDKETSDVTISVVNEKDEEIGSFPCHSAILAASSEVFRAMLLVSEGMAERKSGVVAMNDVSPEVIDHFLSFVYTGRFKSKRKANENGFVEVWVEIVPQLVYMADKYRVEDLLEFCDHHFHIAVNEGNALEMYKLAKRHGLKRAQARLREDFAKNIDLLLQSIAH